MDLNKNESLNLEKSEEVKASPIIPEIAPKQSMLNKIGAILVFAISFFTFLSTMAPTVSFWDCGEYIASCYSLGIPHPPGNPFYVLLGRVFTMLMFWTDQVAYRVNMISVISGAFTALFLYLTVGRGLRLMVKDLEEKEQSIIMTVAGFVGALFGVLNYTFWFSAVEASVYIPSVLVVVMNIYIALVWAQSKDENRDRYLLLFSYLAFLGLGIHMFSMLALPPIFIYIMLVDKEKLRDWRVWGVALLLGSVIYSVAAFIYVAPVLLIMTLLYAYTPRDIARVLNLLIALGLLVVRAKIVYTTSESGLFMNLLPYLMMLALSIMDFLTDLEPAKSTAKWKLSFYIVLFAIMGYSAHAYIPIRSALEPMIDENHPVVEWKDGKIEWDAFKGFLERRQYGNESMVTRMFHRRGAIGTQFGIDGHMGYGGFHLTQFFHFGESISADRDFSDESTINNTKLNKAFAYQRALKKDKRLTAAQRDANFRQYLEQNEINVGDLMFRKMINLLLYLIPTMIVIWAIGYWLNLEVKSKRGGKSNIIPTSGFLALFKPIAFILHAAQAKEGEQKEWTAQAILFTLIFLTTSIGMVLAMNFADGTKAEKADYLRWKQQAVKAAQMGQPAPQQPTPVHREVRIRDYFYTAGFTFFGMWMGLAAGAILFILYSSRSLLLRKQLAPVVVGLFVVSPALPFSQNYHENNRTNDWIPYDYAYNLLMSCEEGGILFTNGDNDTFPLWFLQEAEGIRRDVRVVNLSLLNTRWYIKQLKKLEPKVPMGYSFADIENESRLNHQYNPIEKSSTVQLPKSKLQVTLPGRDRKSFLRIQDLMVVSIADANFALPKEQQKPIYFSVTVSPDNLMGLDPYLTTEGMVYRVGDKMISERDRMNFERTKYLLDKVYSFRNLGDNTTPLSETARKLMGNYSAAFLHYAFNLRMPVAQAKGRIEQIEKKLAEDSLVTVTTDSSVSVSEKPSIDRVALMAEKDSLQTYYNETVDEIINKMDRCVSIIPWDYRTRRYRHQFLMEFEKYELAVQRMKEALMIEPNHSEYKQLLESAEKLLKQQS